MLKTSVWGAFSFYAYSLPASEIKGRSSSSSSSSSLRTTTQMDNPNGQPKWTTQMDNPNGQPKWTQPKWNGQTLTQMKWTNP